MKALSISNLHKSYNGFEAVKGINFDIEEGSFFGFLGPNGAGKTTTINCIIGLAKFSQGNIQVFGKNILNNYRDVRKLIGLSPQDYNFDPYLSAIDVLLYQAGYYGIPKREALPRAEELLKQFKLEKKYDVDYRRLSGGMKRRLTLARSLVHNPKFLILDEPTSGVDVELRHEIHRYLQKLNKQGITILLTSHYLDEVQKLCNHICIIDNGKIIANESTKSLLKRLDDGHTEILTNKPSKKLDLPLVEFHRNKIIVWNRGKKQLKQVFHHLQQQNIQVLDMKNVNDSLEEIFLRLTKKEGSQGVDKGDAGSPYRLTKK